MTTALDPVGIAARLVVAGDESVIVIDIENSASRLRMTQQFPSLSDEQIDMLDRPLFLALDGWKEAVETFERLTRDCAENDAFGLVSGTVTLVCRPFGEDDGHEIHRWDLDEDTRPVFRDLRWTREDIALRG